MLQQYVIDNMEDVQLPYLSKIITEQSFDTFSLNGKVHFISYDLVCNHSKKGTKTSRVFVASGWLTGCNTMIFHVR